MNQTVAVLAAFIAGIVSTSLVFYTYTFSGDYGLLVSHRQFDGLGTTTQPFKHEKRISHPTMLYECHPDNYVNVTPPPNRCQPWWPIPYPYQQGRKKCETVFDDDEDLDSASGANDVFGEFINGIGLDTPELLANDTVANVTHSVSVKPFRLDDYACDTFNPIRVVSDYRRYQRAALSATEPCHDCKYLFVQVANNGLGNRVENIREAVTLAVLMERAIVIWNEIDDFDLTAYFNLKHFPYMIHYEKVPPLIGGKQIPQTVKTMAEFRKWWAPRVNLHRRKHGLTEYTTDESMHTVLRQFPSQDSFIQPLSAMMENNDDADVIVIDCRQFLAPDFRYLNDPRYELLMSALGEVPVWLTRMTIAPLPHVKKQIDEVVDSATDGGRSKLITAHFRTRGNLWYKEPDHEDAKFRAQHMGQAAKCINMASNNHAIVIVVTDSAKRLRAGMEAHNLHHWKLIEHEEQPVLTNSDSHVKASLNRIADAIAFDFFILSRGDLVVGTQTSSFSYMAAQLTFAPLLMIGPDTNCHSDDRVTDLRLHYNSYYSMPEGHIYFGALKEPLYMHGSSIMSAPPPPDCPVIPPAAGKCAEKLQVTEQYVKDLLQRIVHLENKT